MTKKKARKSYFYQYLKCFVLILIVPFLTILLIYGQSSSIVKKLVLDSSRNTLSQYVKRIDKVLEDAADVCLKVSVSQESKDYAMYVTMVPDRSAYRALLLKNRLQGYGGELYEDIFLYFPKFGKVVSGENGSLETEMYCRAYYGEKYLQDFWHVLEGESGRATVGKIAEENGTAYLCVSMRYKIRTETGDESLAVAVLRQSYFSELMNDLQGVREGGYFILLDEKQKPIFSTRGLEIQPEILSDGSDLFEAEVNGERCIVQIRTSEVLDAYYAYAVPYSYFWEKLEHLCMLCGWGGVISIILSVVLAWLQAHRVYRPVKKIVSGIQDRNEKSYDSGKTSEFEFIERVLREEEQEKLKMEVAVHRGNEAIRSRYVAALLEGRAECRDAGEAELETHGIPLCSTCFQVGVLEIEQTGEIAPELLTFVIENVLGEVCNEKHRVYMVPKQDKRIAMLLNLAPEESTTDFFDLIQTGKDFLEERCGITFTCGISSVKQEIGEIPTAYAEAELALKYRYLLGKEIIIEHIEIADREFKYIPPLENKIYHRITQFVADGHLHMSSDMLVKQILDDYGIDGSTSMETVECFKYEMLSALARVVMVGKCWDGFWEESVKWLIEAETEEEFIEELSEFLLKLCRRRQEKDETEDICRQAYDYIQKNYRDVQLSLKYLGEELECSASYLSRVFKERYCVSIPDQITRVRCEHAKEELRNTSLSVQKIAENNGFVSADTFIKVFKKSEGLTPGNYRKQGK